MNLCISNLDFLHTMPLTRLIIYQALCLLGLLFGFSTGVPLQEGSHVAQVRVSQTNSKLTPYQLQVSTPEGYIKIPLQAPEHPVYTSSYTGHIMAEDGSLTEDGRITPEVVSKLQATMFVHPETHSVVHINKIAGGYVVEGMVDGWTLEHDNGVHRVAKLSVDLNENLSATSKIYSNDNGQMTQNDYVVFQRNDTKITARGATPPAFTIAASGGQVSEIFPELYVLIDKTFEDRIYMSHAYIGRLIQGVNFKFWDGMRQNYPNTLPRISFKLSLGVIATAVGPDISTASVTPDGTGIDMAKLLDNLARAMKKQTDLTGPGPQAWKPDIVLYLSGRDLQLKDANGVFSKSYAGLAHLGGACASDSVKFYGTIVAEELGRSFSSVPTVAHELAHVLGAPHDGEGVSAACPWADGYAMSYLGHGTKNKWSFSKCTMESIRKFVTSELAACLYREDGRPTDWPSNFYEWGAKDSGSPGDWLSMDDICKDLTRDLKSVVDPARTPDELCLTLSCKFTQNGVAYTGMYPSAVPDNTKCKEDRYGVSTCYKGTCIAQNFWDDSERMGEFSYGWNKP